MPEEVRHELANLLSIALANLEAMADGVLETTPQRLKHICDALRTAGTLLEELKEPAEGATDG